MVECASRHAAAPTLQMMGHEIQGDCFFHKLPVNNAIGSNASSSLLASILLEADSISMVDMVLELNRPLVIEDQDWEVSRISKKEFQLVFPNKQNLRLCLNSGGMKLPISKAEVLFAELAMDA